MKVPSMRLRYFALFCALAASPAACAPTVSIVPDARPRDGASAPDAAAWTECHVGQTRCHGEVYQRCVADGEFTTVQNDDCAARGQVCLDERGGCFVCRPGALRCSEDATTLERCREDASGWDALTECDVSNGFVCRGERCRSLCDDSDVVGSNVGCEYYAVDLDNAVTNDAGETAASQQFAVVISNPDPRFTARVRIEWNTAAPGMPLRIATVASSVIPPMDLEVFPLPAREVDCSMPGTFNTGSGTCLSSQAYRITSTAPVIAYQFNPLSNVQVFSNDASLLVPTNSLTGDYVAMGWPQTLASSPPEIVLDPSDPIDLRGFVAVVGTHEGTRVRVVPRADVIPGGPLTERVAAGTPIEVTLGPFDVLNLETGAFRADLTGTTVLADKPVAVFSGSECSDVPDWAELNDRQCCCDHLEAQQFPRTTWGTHYVAAHTPSRSAAVRGAGAMVALVPDEPDFVRVMALNAGTTHVRTTLPTNPADPGSPALEFDLTQGEFRTIRAPRDFEIEATAPVSVANFWSSQLNTGIPLRYPGGDGSFIPIPSIEQWRRDYVFLTPDRYAFDFVTVIAPAGASVSLDDAPLPTVDCETARGDGCIETPRHICPPPRYRVYRCQLSYPEIDPDLPYPQNVRAGRQRDGVHVVRASEPVAVLVEGFDLRVSYGYPAGTLLRSLF